MKKTWRYYIDGRGYYEFKNFKVYWTYTKSLLVKKEKLKIGIGFEQYLLDQGFEVLHNPETNYFNTYNHTSRLYSRDGKGIMICLMDSPTRIGVLLNVDFHPVTKEIIKDWSYAPEPHEYELYLEKCLR